jgi:hypothetical protein
MATKGTLMLACKKSHMSRRPRDNGTVKSAASPIAISGMKRTHSQSPYRRVAGRIFNQSRIIGSGALAFPAAAASLVELSSLCL